MNLNHGYIFDPDDGQVYCTNDVHLCIDCQGFVVRPYEHPDESYVHVGARQGPSYATCLPTATAVVDESMPLVGAMVVQASKPGETLGEWADDGWAVVSTGHAQGDRRRCDRCHGATCQTVVTGRIGLTWSRPMEEALEHIRDGTHIFDRFGIVPR